MVAAAQTVSLVLGKLQNLLHEKKFVSHAGFRDKFNEAIRELRQDAESNDESMQNLARLETWLLPTIYDAEDIISTFLVRAAQQRQKGFIKAVIRSLIWWSQSQSRKDLALMLINMEDRLRGGPWRMHPRIVQTKNASDSRGGSIINPSEEPRRQDSGSTSDYSGQQLESDRTVGREKEIKELLYRMIHHDDDDDQLRVISVVGMGAVGKTALARYVYDRSDIKEHFQCRVWVRDPNTLVHKDLLVDILSQLPISQLRDVEHMTEEMLEETLCKFLMEKRYLVVLDDVLELDNWYKLTIPFADYRNGSRVILTTRSEGVAENADPLSPPIQLLPLTDEKSWELFKNKAAAVAVRRPENSSGGSLNDTNWTDQFIDHKDRILRICHGSPLALVLLGGLLSTTELNQWSTVLLELEKFCEEAAQSDAVLKDIAAWSYHKLPFWLQPCFLYFIHFPKAFEIPTRRLLGLWLAEGFQTWSPDAQEVPEDVRVHRNLLELVHRNVIEVERWRLDGSPKTCRMPGFLHETFSREAEKIGLSHGNRRRSSMSSSDPSNSATSSVPTFRRLALLHFDHYDLTCYPDSIRQLRSYASFNTQKRGTRDTEFVKFLKPAKNLGFKLLKVLDLEGVYKPTLPNEELRELLNLRYVGLRWTGLDSLPACVGDLPFLETLDLKHTNITTLPSSIWKAKKLRHLYMNEIELSMPKASSINLQTLWGLFVGSNVSLLKGLLTRLAGLKKLGVTCHSTSAKAAAEGISKLTNLQSLRLMSRDLIGRASDLDLDPLKDHTSLSKLYLLGLLPQGVEGKQLPKNLKMLTLSMSELKADPMPVIGELHELKILRLYARSYVGTEMTCCSGHFSKLQVLKLWMLEKLDNWIVQTDAMPCLEVLEIRSRKELKKMPNGLEQLSTLKELILTNMPQEFVKDIKENRGNDRKYALITKEWDFSPLEE